MIGLLNTLGIRFEREYRLGSSFQCSDFYLPEYHRAIEVHGRIHRFLDVEERARNDERKRALLAEIRIECLWITDEDLKDLIALAGQIKAFLAGEIEKAA
jgi:very-short-patch-repair endonuclease